MKYEKPELVLLGTASNVVQALTKGQGPNDNPEEYPSTPAYEADE
jgi:hypothetical protein